MRESLVWVPGSAVARPTVSCPGMWGIPKRHASVAIARSARCAAPRFRYEARYLIERIVN